MTPLALSGGCQAREMVCLVMSLAWMDVTGEGAGGTKKKKTKEKLSPLLCCCRLITTAAKVKLPKENPFSLNYTFPVNWSRSRKSQTIKSPKAKKCRSTSELMANINKTNTNFASADVCVTFLTQLAKK